MVWLKCPGHRSIEFAYLGVAVGISGWVENTRNSMQQKHYTNAFAEKMKTRNPMVSLYDDYTVSVGKTTKGHSKRWMSLFSDGSFVALDSYSESGFFWRRHRVTFVSGIWARASGTMVALQRQDGTNWCDYAFLDLSSSTNFPAAPIHSSFQGIPRNEEHWNMLLERATMSAPTSTP